MICDLSQMKLLAKDQSEGISRGIGILGGLFQNCELSFKIYFQRLKVDTSNTGNEIFLDFGV